MSAATDLPPFLSNFFLFRQTPGFDDSAKTERLKNVPVDFSRIRCPLCEWQPNRASRWVCSDFRSHDGCGTCWNTFETRGQCPGCNYYWRWTDCLRCHRSSPHAAWYRNATD